MEDIGANGNIESDAKGISHGHMGTVLCIYTSRREWIVYKSK
jgi:hypothetical protein